MSIPSESQSDGDGQKQTGNPASFAFHNLNVYGYISSENVQKTFFSYASSVLAQLVGKFLGSTQESEVCILQNLEGLVSDGEVLLVLGRPGSGCTTLL